VERKFSTAWHEAFQKFYFEKKIVYIRETKTLSCVVQEEGGAVMFSAL